MTIIIQYTAELCACGGAIDVPKILIIAIDDKSAPLSALPSSLRILRRKLEIGIRWQESAITNHQEYLNLSGHYSHIMFTEEQAKKFKHWSDAGVKPVAIFSSLRMTNSVIYANLHTLYNLRYKKMLISPHVFVDNSPPTNTSYKCITLNKWWVLCKKNYLIRKVK